MSFSTSAANAAFKEAFTVPATALLSPPVESATSKEVYTSLGKLWANGHRAVQALEGAERGSERNAPNVGLHGLSRRQVPPVVVVSAFMVYLISAMS